MEIRAFLPSCHIHVSNPQPQGPRTARVVEGTERQGRLLAASHTSKPCAHAPRQPTTWRAACRPADLLTQSRVAKHKGLVGCACPPSTGGGCRERCYCCRLFDGPQWYSLSGPRLLQAHLSPRHREDCTVPRAGNHPPQCRQEWNRSSWRAPATSTRLPDMGNMSSLRRIEQSPPTEYRNHRSCLGLNSSFRV